MSAWARELVSASVRSGAPSLVRYLHTVLKTPSPLARYRASETRQAVEGDLVLLEVGPAEARHRLVMALGPVAPETLFTRARAFFGGERFDSVELAVECAPEVEAELRRRGWRLAKEEPALVMEAGPARLPPPPAELMVRRARDEVALEDFYAVSPAGRRHVPSAEAVRDPNVAVLVGYVAGEAVATSRVSGHGEVADIMGVVTHVAHRRRGYGTAMTWAAVGAAREMGCSAYLLTATEMGYPVYVKMGFTPFCTLRSYEPEAAPA